MPHTETTFYKLAVGWAEDPKVSSLARFGAVEAVLARDLFSQMIGFARRNLTDGWVPVEEVGRLAYPLDADHAARLAAHLTDRGAYGPLCEPDTDRNAIRILAYARWNDTAEEVRARTESGRNAAKHRWAAPHAAPTSGDAGWTPHRMLDASGPHSGPHTEREVEVNPPRARAPARAGGRGGTPTPPPVEEVIPRGPKPGADVAHRGRQLAGDALAAAKHRRPRGEPAEPAEPAEPEPGPNPVPGFEDDPGDDDGPPAEEAGDDEFEPPF